MHMVDALLTPQVGAVFWGATAGMIASCSRKLKQDPDDSRIPLMGVMGAFVFAAQMINVTIPVTGSSGHLGGGLLLAILLGPAAAFLTIASVLVVQALFFADGGLLALGCNIFNLGFIPAFVAYPLVFRPLAGASPGRRRLSLASLVAALAALQLGSFGVVLQTTWSGIAALPFTAFLTVMQPIHLVIGLVEGLATAVVVNLMRRGQPDLVPLAAVAARPSCGGRRRVTMVLLCVTVLTGGVLSWYASSLPDGLEWSILQVADEKVPSQNPLPEHGLLESLQERVALLPDYGFSDAAEAAGDSWQTRSGVSLSGLLGSGLTLMLILLFGLFLKKRFPYGS